MFALLYASGTLKNIDVILKIAEEFYTKLFVCAPGSGASFCNWCRSGSAGTTNEVAMAQPAMKLQETIALRVIYCASEGTLG